MRSVGLLTTAVIAGLLSAGFAAAAPATPWDGFYIGGQLGGGWSATTWDVGPAGIANEPDGAGGFPATGLTMGNLAGVRAGYGFQFGSFMLGVEGAFSGANITGQIHCGSLTTLVYGYMCVTDLDALATMTARAGIGVGGTLFYATGGVALAWQRHEVQEPSLGILSWGTASETARGWTVGAGVQHALSHGFSMRADYAYVRLPQRDLVLESPFFVDSPVSLAQGYHLASVGFDFRFGGPANAGAERNGKWGFDVGTRQWLNSGRYRFDLYHPTNPGEQISRIDYGHYAGLATEAFVRAAPDGGRLFINVAAGTGAAVGGMLVDHDYPPVTDPLSITQSRMQDTRLGYASVDVGLTVVAGDRFAAGAFAGVTGLIERYAAYGCEQLATSGVCDPTIPFSVPAISQTTWWGAIRVGAIAQVGITDRLWLRGEGAVLRTTMYAEDNHWLRPTINPLIETGRGWGVQLQAELTYQVSDKFTVGLGARYSQLVAHGTAYFPTVAEPQTTTSRHYGVFFQATHTIGN